MSYISDLDDAKINAQAFDDHVRETHFVSDPVTGQRRIPKTRTWRVEQMLGRGGFGQVRLESCMEDNTKRAVKRLDMDSRSLNNHKNEVRALLEFSKPKYKESAVFVEFWGWFDDAHGHVFLAMEYLPLGDLETYAIKNGALTELELKEVASQILEGLRIMHQKSFAHRDLKPQNILICHGPPKWWIKLADFGLSRRFTTESASNAGAGTLRYMAPEICETPTYQFPMTAVDLWALGAVMFRLSSGTTPPFCLELKTKTDRPHFLNRSLSMLSRPGVAFVIQLLDPNPSTRPTTTQALNDTWIAERNANEHISSSPGVSLMDLSIDQYSTTSLSDFPSAELPVAERAATILAQKADDILSVSRSRTVEPSLEFFGGNSGQSKDTFAGKLGNMEDLVKLYEEKKGVLGPEHPDTLEGMHSLARTYRKQKRYEEAEDLYVQVVEARKRVLGPEYPDTLHSMHNLAMPYGDQKRDKQIENYQRQRVKEEWLKQRKKDVEERERRLSVLKDDQRRYRPGEWGRDGSLFLSVT